MTSTALWETDCSSPPAYFCGDFHFSSTPQAKNTTTPKQSWSVLLVFLVRFWCRYSSWLGIVLYFVIFYHFFHHRKYLIFIATVYAFHYFVFLPCSSSCLLYFYSFCIIFGPLETPACGAPIPFFSLPLRHPKLPKSPTGQPLNC